MEHLINQDLSPLKLLFQFNSDSGLADKISDFFPGVIYIYDADTKKLKYINRKITDLLGYTIDDVNNWNDGLIDDIVFKDDLERVRKELKKFYELQDNECHSYNARLNHKEGNWKYFKTQGTILERDSAGHPASILFIAQDISEEIETTSKFKRIEELFNDTQEVLKFGVWEWDVQANTMSWSNGLYRLLGYDPIKEKDKQPITPEFYLQHIVETDRDNVLHTRKEQLIQHEYDTQYKILDRHGRIKDVLEKAKVIRNDKNEVLRVIGSTIDVTEQLQLYRDLATYQTNLEEKIQDLDRSNKELEEFAYVASHDMNEPLRKITTFIERLDNKYRNELGADGQLYLTRIAASVENMRLLIDTLLEFSRTARNNQPFKQVNLNTIITEVQADLELKIEETATRIQVGELPVIDAVPSQMKQLFDNLLSNSIKFRKADTLSVINIQSQRLTTRQKEEYRLDSGKTWFKIVFSDNGIGFEPEYSERIFKIFQRLHGKTEYPGSGIGLAICKKIIDQHKGLINATGEPDKGATFTLILPETQ